MLYYSLKSLDKLKAIEECKRLATEASVPTPAPKVLLDFYN
jgi:hypothetical protein